jgi:hypothetical protein
LLVLVSGFLATVVGIHKVVVLLLQGQFLVDSTDKNRFLDWLKEQCPSMTARHLHDTYRCLDEWCRNNL